MRRNKKFVFYSDELNDLCIASRNDAYFFTDGVGVFVILYDHKYGTHVFRMIGEY